MMSGTGGRYAADLLQFRGRAISRLSCAESGLSVCLSPEDGAEVSSIAVRDSRGTHELLYRGNDWRPVDGWPGRAPWLWPVAGRTYGANDTDGEPVPSSACHWLCGRRVLPMQHHGFARLKRWRAETSRVDEAGAHAYASCHDTEVDRSTYPFSYQLSSGVSLLDSTVTFTFQVTAGHDNDQPMPFTIGHHLTFDLRSWWGRDWLNGTLHGAGPAAHGVNGLMLADQLKALPSDPLVIGDRSLGDLLIPAAPGKTLRLTSPDRGRHVELSFTTSSLPSPDAALWVTHCDQAGRFFCLEPWIGWPNGINTGRGRVTLNPGEVWSMSSHMRIVSIRHPSRADNPGPGGVEIVSGLVPDPARPRRRPTADGRRIRESR